MLPEPDCQWAKGLFGGITNGLGYNFSVRRGMRYGSGISADFGRKESRERNRRLDQRFGG